MVVLAFDLVERLRRTIRQSAAALRKAARIGSFSPRRKLAAGALVALLLVGYEVLLGNAIAATSVDALHFSLHPLVSRPAWRLPSGLILAQAVVFWTAILVVMLATAALAIAAQRQCRPCGICAAGAPRSSHFDLSANDRRGALDGSRAPDGICRARVSRAGMGHVVGTSPLPPCVAGAPPLRGALVLLITAFVLYPSVHHFADRGLRRLIEEEYARQAKDQREELKAKLRTVLQQIDALEMPKLDGRAANAARHARTRRSSCGGKRTSRASGLHRRSSCIARKAGWPADFA